MKIIIALAFLAIIASLGAAYVFMVRGDPKDDQPSSTRMAHALAVRVILSIVLFVCLLAAYKLGYILPTGLLAGKA
ncbi:twin transmembrane helix small protein [Comamonas flocculans]|uniref:Twin transmembrane helix small protein n=1 Tax=Comamonas flocculans TaxID=2597701 RepID=A0A5B8RTC3_9BURK|nr:twin transmembrane helix small protein [Comamonas flocculans]QEA11974.1 twin transmembrane helix small protein [Comamonas flocculans]